MRQADAHEFGFVTGKGRSRHRLEGLGDGRQIGGHLFFLLLSESDDIRIYFFGHEPIQRLLEILKHAVKTMGETGGAQLLCIRCKIDLVVAHELQHAWNDETVAPVKKPIDLRLELFFGFLHGAVQCAANQRLHLMHVILVYLQLFCDRIHISGIAMQQVAMKTHPLKQSGGRDVDPFQLILKEQRRSFPRQYGGEDVF